MYTTLGIVEIPQVSIACPAAPRGELSREPLKTRKIAGKPLLEWVIRRVTESQRLDRVIVVMPASRQAELGGVIPSDISTYAGEEPSNLGRFAGALRKFPCQSAVRVGVDNPFVDPALIDRLVISALAHGECDYASYCCKGRPAVLSRMGLFAEWCRSQAVLRADKEAISPDDRSQVTRYLFTRPELFQLRLLQAPAPLHRDDLRLALQTEEDWHHAETIFEALGAEGLEWQRIAGLLDHHPAIRERMAVLNQEEEVA